MESTDKKPVAGNVIAHGAATGHSHKVTGDGAVVLAEGEVLTVDAPNGAVVVHDEHDDITIPGGNYAVGTVLEYDHAEEEAHDVID